MKNLSKVELGDFQAQTHFCMQYPTPGINSDTGIVSTTFDPHHRPFGMPMFPAVPFCTSVQLFNLIVCFRG